MADLVRSKPRLCEFRLSACGHEQGFPKSERTADTENLEHLRPMFHRLSNGYGRSSRINSACFKK